MILVSIWLKMHYAMDTKMNSNNLCNAHVFNFGFEVNISFSSSSFSIFFLFLHSFEQIVIIPFIAQWKTNKLKWINEWMNVMKSVRSTLSSKKMAIKNWWKPFFKWEPFNLHNYHRLNYFTLNDISYAFSFWFWYQHSS